MKKLAWVLAPLALLPVVASAQFDGDPSTKPAAKQDKKAEPSMADMMKPMKGSPELKKLGWMVGSYSMKGKAYNGPEAMTVSGMSKVSWGIGDSWLITEESMKMGKGMPTLHGFMTMSYNAQEKVYMAYWMDDTMGVAMPMKGQFEGDDKLVFHADAMGPMPASTYTMTKTKNGSKLVATTTDGKPLLDLDYVRMAKKKKAKKPAAKKVAAKAMAPKTTEGTAKPVEGTAKVGGN